MVRVLVTGASGFIGQQLVEALVARGDDVTCLVRRTSQVEPLTKLGARLATGDVTDAASLPAAVAHVDVVYHVAGLTKAIGPADYNRVNEAGVQNVVAACARRTSPPVVVVVSSLAAAGPMPDETRLRTESDPPQPASHYGRSKRAGELAAEALAGEVSITVVRPPIVLGPGDVTGLALFRNIRRMRAFMVLRKERSLSVVHVTDLTAALIAAAQRGQRLPAHSISGDPGCGYYFVAADQHPWFAELARMVGRAVGRTRLWKIRVPVTTLWITGGVSDLVARITRRPRYLTLDRAREITAGHWICSPEKARRDLGFVPGAALEERIQQTAQWYRQQGWL